MREKGSLTIEAAMILPVFMLGLLTLVSVIPMLMTGMRIQECMFNEAGHMAVLRGDGRSIGVSQAKDSLTENLPASDAGYIRDGIEGIDMTGSYLDNPEYVELKVNCTLIPLTQYFGISGITLERKCLAHVWCGYERGFFPDEEYVYITEDGEVYHRDRECSHILLSIRETDAGEIAGLRNKNGGRYYPCSACHSSLADGKLYVTSDGDRYHNSLKCSGLKRSVRAVRLSEAGGRRPCSRCGR